LITKIKNFVNSLCISPFLMGRIKEGGLSPLLLHQSGTSPFDRGIIHIRSLTNMVGGHRKKDMDINSETSNGVNVDLKRIRNRPHWKPVAGAEAESAPWRAGAAAEEDGVLKMKKIIGIIGNFWKKITSVPIIPYSPSGISRKKLLSLKRKAFLSFYGRPAVFLRNLCRVRSAEHFAYLARRAYNWLLRF